MIRISNDIGNEKLMEKHCNKQPDTCRAGKAERWTAQDLVSTAKTD